EPYPLSDIADFKENRTSSCFNKDPIYRRILQDRRRPLHDVFLLPLITPSNQDDYEFRGDEDFLEEQANPSPRSESRQTSRDQFDSPCNNLDRPGSAHSASHTALLCRRRKQRLQKLRDAIMYIFPNRRPFLAFTMMKN
ncbi:unnamed protein product, partial [Strongylus vulgaris]